MEKVESKFTQLFFPLLIETTQLPANILKHPPRKAPLTALRKKQATISGVIIQKKTKMTVTPMQLQNKEQPFKCFFTLCPRLFGSFTSCLLQKQPKNEEPMRVPALKTMGTEEEYALKPLCVRQVGIQRRKPQSIDLRRPKANRQSLFSRGLMVFFAKLMNSLNLQFFSWFPSSGLASRRLSWRSNCSLLASFNSKKTLSPVITLMTAAESMANSHLRPIPLTMKPAKANPTMLPRSPLADQVPIAVPYFSRSKCSLVRVKRVGQAGNWQKPNTKRASPGSISLKKQLSLTPSPRLSESIGITRQAQQAMLMKIMQDFKSSFFPSSRKRKKKPMPRERQTRASKSPSQRLLCSKDFWKLGLTCEQLILML